MANERLSELTNHTNPVDTDLIEVSNYTGVADPETGSLYQSLKLTLLNLYTYILNKLKLAGEANTITTITFTGSGVESYTILQYEVIKNIICSRKSISSQTIKVGLGGVWVDPNLDSILSETDINYNTVDYYNEYSAANRREIKITVSGACTVKIISIKGL